MEAQEAPPFAHPVESALARLLDAHRIAWEYEPHEFVLRRDEDGTVREAFTPDFYLPEIGSYVECTVMRQCETTRKNRKVRTAQELHDVVITSLYKRDLKRLGLWLHGSAEPSDVTRTTSAALEGHGKRA
jgi:hypothetical protein